jgi:hypothetical protein
MYVQSNDNFSKFFVTLSNGEFHLVGDNWTFGSNRANKGNDEKQREGQEFHF